MEGKELEIRRLCVLIRLRECDTWTATVRFKASTSLKVGRVNAITETDMVTVGLRASQTSVS